jgi:fumarate hydratase class II
MKSPTFATSHSTQPPRLFARLPTVMQATGLGRSTIYRLVASGAFPIGYEKAALVAKTALANRATIADTADALGVMSAADVQALLVPEKLTRPMRLEE